MSVADAVPPSPDGLELWPEPGPGSADASPAPSGLGRGYPVRRGFIPRHRLVFCVLAHLLLFALSLLSAFGLAYNFDRAFPGPAAEAFPEGWGWLTTLYLPLALLAVPLKAAAFGIAGQYRGSWRYVGLHDLAGVIWAALVGSFFFVGAYFVIENAWVQGVGHSLIDRFDRPMLRQSIFLLDFGLTIGLVSAARILVRFYYEEARIRPAEDVKRVLIIGAGDEAESILRDLRRLPRERFHVVGLLDDRVAPGRAGAASGRIHGTDILGGTGILRSVVAQRHVDEVLIASPHAKPREIRRWVESCSGTGVRFRTAPTVSALMEGRVQVRGIRDVDIADLLGREQVRLDTDALAAQLRGRRIAVTGAGGSIGSELCRQIARFGPESLLLIERAENALFEIDRRLRNEFPRLGHPGTDETESGIVACVADVCDAGRMTELFARYRPGWVFHAAAHKHVPMMESNVGEAVKNNVLGTRVTAEAALGAGVAKMVFISTDKAINPTSVMGCTKRLAEMVVQGLNGRGATQFVTVRFGNVLGSDGSVVPIFKRQIEEGGPVCVTHPDMRRYFMTIPEASQLVLQAGAMGKGGEIFLLDMGEPIRIVDLARDMITLSGLRPDVDVEIKFTGVRPGEKLFEELAMDGEHVVPTGHPKIGVTLHRPEDFSEVSAGIEALVQVVDARGDDQLKLMLAGIVREYAPMDVSAASALP